MDEPVRQKAGGWADVLRAKAPATGDGPSMKSAPGAEAGGQGAEASPQKTCRKTPPKKTYPARAEAGGLVRVQLYLPAETLAALDRARAAANARTRFRQATRSRFLRQELHRAVARWRQWENLQERPAEQRPNGERAGEERTGTAGRAVTATGTPTGPPPGC